MQIAVMSALKGLLATEVLADLGPDQRSGVLEPKQIDDAVRNLARDAKLTSAAQDLFRAGVYLWHDHLESAHDIVQKIESADGSLLHGIMHRREPDYGNAKYWFRRAGTHPIYLSLSIRAGDFLSHRDENDLQSRLVPKKMWDPFAFVDSVQDALAGRFKSKIPILQQLQKFELECFFENLANRI